MGAKYKEEFVHWAIARKLGICRIKANKVIGTINERSDAYFRKYGITKLELLALLRFQEYKCAICREQLTFASIKLDHCHSSNKARGFLCSKCNTLEGFAPENIVHFAELIFSYRKEPPALRLGRSF